MSRASTQFEGVRIAVIQGRSRGGAAENYAYTCSQIRAAADCGAQIICTQELFKTDYFCQSQGLEAFQHAEAIPGPTTQDLQALAAELGVVLIASLFERMAAGLYYNTAVVIDADGRYLGKYRKQHIPQDPYFEEKFYFTPGDLGYPVWQTRFGTIGVLICWDQWYPETARAMALMGAELLFYPTAIGSEPYDASFDTSRMWQRAMQGHSVSNCMPVIAANRIGTEDGQTFYGHSFITNEWGDKLVEFGREEDGVLVATLDLDTAARHRAGMGFFRDRRPELYGRLAEDV